MTESDVDAHLRQFSGDQLAALTRTRDLIARALPGADQVISYGMPTFKIDGIAVVGIDGFARHNSLFPYSGGVVDLITAEKPDWVAAKGTIHFPIDSPMPAALLKKVLGLRIDEINAAFPKPNGQTKEFYDNGRLKFTGRMRRGEMHGGWTWWRRDGSLLRTGSFKDGTRIGDWVSYDRNGEAVKTTHFGK